MLPVIKTLPVNWCVLVLNDDPNLVDPVTKSTLDVIVCTTNVCAVIEPVTIKLLFTVWIPAKVLLLVVA